MTQQDFIRLRPAMLNEAEQSFRKLAPEVQAALKEIGYENRQHLLCFDNDNVGAKWCADPSKATPPHWIFRVNPDYAGPAPEQKPESQEWEDWGIFSFLTTFRILFCRHLSVLSMFLTFRRTPASPGLSGRMVQYT